MKERQQNERQSSGNRQWSATRQLRAVGIATVALVLGACTAAPLPSPSLGPASSTPEPVPASPQPVAGSPNPGAASMTPLPTPTGTADPLEPRARVYHVMVGLDRGVVLFGGATASPPAGGKDLFDTWEYLPAMGWISAVTQDTPWGDAAAFDGQSERVVVLLDGGRVSTYDPAADAWTERPAVGGSTPTSTFGMRAAYDRKSDRTILLDGAGRTWAYDVDTDTWTQSSAATRPAARLWHTLAYDAGSDRVVLFGGTTRLDALFGDTWAYDLNADTWKEMAPATGPSPRRYAAMTYDPGTDRMILFGGVTGDQEQPLGDTWAYDVDADTWTELAPAASPSPRAWHAMAHDPESGMIVLFGGGRTRDEATAETWLYEARANTWTRSEW